MSQRLKAGLSWPGFAVSAGEVDEIGPRVKRSFGNVLWLLVPVPPQFFASAAFGVAQLLNELAIPSVSPNPLPFLCCAFNASRRASHVVSPSFCGPAFGVGHEVNCTVRPRYSVVRPVAARLGLGGPSGSMVEGVGQLASVT